MTVIWWGNGAEEDLGNEGGARDPWDTLVVEGVKFPGIAVVSGAGCRLRVDRKVIPGSSGARSTSFGYEPGAITVTLKIWTEPQLRAFEALLPHLTPARGAHPKAVTVQHPALELLGITSVLVTHMSPISIERGGIGSVKLELMEHRPPKKGQKPATPKLEGGKSKFDLTNLEPGGGAIAESITASRPSDASSGPGYSTEGGFSFDPSL